MNRLVHNQNEEVTAIMAVYNGYSTLINSIDSVLNQTYKNIKLIICDDCSSDDSANLIKNYKSSKIVLLTNTENLGLSKTRKKLLKHVNTKYVAFIDQDDRWHKDKIKKQLEFMRKKNSLMSHTFYTRNNLIKNKKKIIKSDSYIDYDSLLYGNTIAASSVLIDTTNVKGLNSYCDDKQFDCINDYVIWLNILKNTKINAHSVCVPEPLLEFTYHGNNLSRNKIRMIYKFFLVIFNIEKKNLVISCFYLLCNFIRKINYHFIK